MIKVTDIQVEDLENAGCNNGNYPRVTITLDTGEVLEGHTCGCTRGCSRTWCLPKAGNWFKSKEELCFYMTEF